MSNYPQMAAEAGEKYLAMLAQGQDQVIDFVRSSKELMPQMPQMPAGFGAQAPNMPFAVPSARELTDMQFEFATKMLKQQEGFFRKLQQLQPSKAPAKAASTSTRSTPKRASSAKKRTTSARKTSN